ncbi:unnamed protein product [Closterium sp. NIES-54]
MPYPSPHPSLTLSPPNPSLIVHPWPSIQAQVLQIQIFSLTGVDLENQSLSLPSGPSLDLSSPHADLASLLPASGTVLVLHDRGKTGAQGETGPQGETGAEGEKGAEGEEGADGGERGAGGGGA